MHVINKHPTWGISTQTETRWSGGVLLSVFLDMQSWTMSMEIQYLLGQGPHEKQTQQQSRHCTVPQEYGSSNGVTWDFWLWENCRGVVTVWPMFYMQVDSQSRRRLLVGKEVMSGVEWSGERWWRVEKTMSRVILKEMSSCGRDKGEQEKRIKKKEKKMKVKKEWMEGRWGSMVS